MEQTFLNYVLTDIRFSFASQYAVLRTLIIPLTLMMVASVAMGIGPSGAVAVIAAYLLWAMLEWAFLVVRMARRIGLGAEDPNIFLDLTVPDLAAHIIRRYY
jgi:hypothetical protein